MNEDHQKNISMLHERDLERFLENKGLVAKFRQGGITCKFCKTKISIDNLYSILPESGMFNLVCDKGECIQKLLEYVDCKGIKKS